MDVFNGIFFKNENKYRKYCSVFDYSKVLELICCGNSIVAMVI